MYYASVRLKPLIIILLVLVACGPGGNPSSPSGGNPDRGTDPRGFEVETFEGKRFSLEEQRGTPVVLNFWESW